MRQRFFNTFLIAKDNFTNGKIDWEYRQMIKKELWCSTTANLQVKLQAQNNVKAGFSIFYGPADYHTLNSMI